MKGLMRNPQVQIQYKGEVEKWREHANQIVHLLSFT